MGRLRFSFRTLIALIVLIGLPFVVGRVWPGLTRWAALVLWPPIVLTPFVEGRMAKDGEPVGAFERGVVYFVLVTAAGLLCFVTAIEVVPRLAWLVKASPGAR